MIPDCPLRQGHSADRPPAISPAVIKRITPPQRPEKTVGPERIQRQIDTQTGA